MRHDITDACTASFALFGNPPCRSKQDSVHSHAGAAPSSISPCLDFKGFQIPSSLHLSACSARAAELHAELLEARADADECADLAAQLQADLTAAVEDNRHLRDELEELKQQLEQRTMELMAAHSVAADLKVD